MTLFADIAQMRKMLSNLDGCLTKAGSYASRRGFDASVLVQSRLAPDMFALVRQVQAACDSAKYAAARTAGKEPPVHPDTEQTLEELRARVASVESYLDSFAPADFAGADSRTVSLPRWEGKSMTAQDYFCQHALPNFYFHLAMAYAILRHNGVDLGKRDYLGDLRFR